MTLDDVAGHLVLYPGQARPNVRSSRPVWVERLMRGKPCEVLPDLLGSLFTLCGSAHRLCAAQAVQVARGHRAFALGGHDRELQADTLREHVRRLFLDWPRFLGGEDRDLAPVPLALHSCPAFTSTSAQAMLMASMQAWLAQHVFGMAPQDWLDRREREPRQWLAQWAQDFRTLPACLLLRCQSVAERLLATPRALRVHADAAALTRLAQHVSEDAGYTSAPLWEGQCAETGTWTRLNDAPPESAQSAWLRLGSRLAEVARLCLPDAAGRCGSGWLCSGAIALAPGEGMAWVEMARGLLVHWLQVDADGRVAACRVLAPTEWNFHPQGAVAAALENMPGQACAEQVAQANTLMAAYDPCVRFEIQTKSRAAENVPHA